MRKPLGQLTLIVINIVLIFIVSVKGGTPQSPLYFLLMLIAFPLNLLFEKILNKHLIPFYGTLFLLIFVSLVNIFFSKNLSLTIPLSLFILLINYYLTFAIHGHEDAPAFSLTIFLSATLLLLILTVHQIPPLADPGAILTAVVIFTIGIVHTTFLVQFIQRSAIDPEVPAPFSELRSTQKYYAKIVKEIRESSEMLKRSSQMIISQAQAISTSSQEMNASAEEISSTIQSISKGTNEQSRSISTIAESIEALLKITNGIVSHAKMTSVSASKAAKTADEGTRLVEEASQIVDDLVSFTQELREKLTGVRFLGDEVRKILDLIRVVADQTELLAINAAIEAARSGEAGKGFSVVAEEIRGLANKSLEASKKVEDMIKEVDHTIEAMFETVDLEVEKVDKNQKITAQSLNQYDAIAKTIRLTSDQIKQVVDSTGHQSEETKQIAQQVDIITKVAEDTASSTEEVAAAVEQLTASLEELSSRASELAAIAKDLESLDRSIS